MKKIVAFIALAGAASSVFGAEALNDFRLDLSLTARSGSASVATPLSDIQTGGLVNATVGTTYRVELRYRIQDLAVDTQNSVGSNGLSSAKINFNITGGTATNVVRARLSNNQLNSTNNSPLNPDSSVFTTTTSQKTGLVGLFRGGLDGKGPDGVAGTADDSFPDEGLSNGGHGAGAFNTALGNNFSIVPLALSAPSQKSYDGDGPAYSYPKTIDPDTGDLVGPLESTTQNTAAVWAVYSFSFTYGGGVVNIRASAEADAGSGARFGFFRQNDLNADGVPVTSVNATDGTISFVPAPGAAALMGIGGLLAARRRRA